MLLLVAFVGWVVLRYAATYLDGEPRQGPFTGWLCVTLAAVLLLVQAGNLVAPRRSPGDRAGLGLQRLLLFYPDRPGARRAARKKAIFARHGRCRARSPRRCCSASASALPISARSWPAPGLARRLPPPPAPRRCSALAALLKSAQFPTHGWLTEVMEAPTPGLGAAACRA